MQKKKQRQGCERGALLAWSQDRNGYLLTVLGWDGAEQCRSLDGCKGAERVISRQGTAALKRMDHSREMVSTCFIILSRLRQVITHESDHEVFNSWTTEEAVCTACLCLAESRSWWLIQLKSHLTSPIGHWPKLAHFPWGIGLSCTTQLLPS